MQLLVSVRNAAEAAAALAGGADIIDAKEPLNGALGAVSAETLDSIAACVGAAVPLSMALGDIDHDVVGRADAALRARARFVKVGFAGSRGDAQLADDVVALARAVHSSTLVLVGYADYASAGGPPPGELLQLANRVGAAGVLLDTFDKHGAALTSLMPPRTLTSFVRQAKSAGRLVALAGRLTADDIDVAADTGADVIGFRGAACEGGRSGTVTSARVRALHDQVKGMRHVG